MDHANAFETDLDRNPANYAPLTPLGFIERAAYVYPERTAVVHGARRYTWAQTYARCRRLASALAAARHRHGRHGGGDGCRTRRRCTNAISACRWRARC